MTPPEPLDLRSEGSDEVEAEDETQLEDSDLEFDNRAVALSEVFGGCGRPGAFSDDVFNDDAERISTPDWVKDRPKFTFILHLRKDWGPKVTKLYNDSRNLPLLTHSNVKEIL